MPKFLIIAEKVYKKLEEDKLFSDNLIEQLNNLVSIIRKEIKGTPVNSNTILSILKNA